MDVPRDARTTPHGRRRIIHRLAEGWPVEAVASAAGVDAKTVRKGRDRQVAEGAAGRSPIGVALRRRGLGRLGALDPKPAVIRYQRDQPGELIHLDIKVEPQRGSTGRIDGAGHRVTGDRRGQKRGTG